MTATAEVRFGEDSHVTLKSYVRLTASTHIMCCTYDDAAPILSLRDGQVDITITNPGKGEVTAEDVTFGHMLAEAVTRYAAERRDGTADGGGAAGAGTSGRPWVLSPDMEEVIMVCAAS
jgi:hypothetical protein